MEYLWATPTTKHNNKIKKKMKKFVRKPTNKPNNKIKKKIKYSQKIGKMLNHCALFIFYMHLTHTYRK